MKMVPYRDRITVKQALAGIVAILTILLLTQPSRADGDDHRALQLLLNKGIITQQEYDQAVTEEQREKQAQEKQVNEKQANEAAKNGLQVKIGGFAELDFMGDNTRSFDEIIGNRAVLRSNTLGGANGRFETSPRNSRVTLDVRAPERNGIKSQYFAAVDFLGNEPDIATASVSELTARTSPTARIFQMYFKVETPVVDVKVGQDWSRFGFMSEYSRGQVSVAATPANMFNRWVQASISKRIRLTDTLSLTPVFSVERPPHRDANLPSFVAGVQLAHHGLQAPYSGSSSGGVSLKPLSLQISGVGRRLEANSGGSTNLNSQTYVTGWGASSSLFIPVLPSRNGEMGNTALYPVSGS